MNRIEFMTELAALLQDVPEEERRDAMQYYNDYFDDAGEEKEQQVISELESPKKVAEKIKADFIGQQGEKEYTETGYKDSRFEKNDIPAEKEHENNGGYHYRDNTTYQYRQDAQYQYQDNGGQQKPWSSNVLKVILIIAIILIGAPIVIPCALAVVAVVVACVVALFAFFFAIVIGFAAIAIIGLVLVCAGLVAMIPEIAVGLALFGTGLILGVIGTVGTIAGVKLCMVVLPGICRGIVWICRKPFHRKAVA